MPPVINVAGPTQRQIANTNDESRGSIQGSPDHNISRGWLIELLDTTATERLGYCGASSKRELLSTTRPCVTNEMPAAPA